jgi:hypothetical protein
LIGKLGKAWGFASRRYDFFGIQGALKKESIYIVSLLKVNKAMNEKY